MSILEDELDKYLSPPGTYPEKLNDAMRYAVFSGGKRLRPILFFATYELLKGRKNISSLQRTLPAACALELVHTASLVHDDLPSIDNADERRGKPSCHKKYDVPTAILVGDALLTKAFEVLTDFYRLDESIECTKILTHAVSTRGMLGGQAVDILSTQKKRIKINTVRFIHLKKTGALLRAATEMACALNETPVNIKMALNNFAINIGLAYQIVDDILDEVGNFDVLGRKPGSDMKNKKATYTSILGLEESKKKAEKLLKDSAMHIKNLKGNDILMGFIKMIKQRLP